MGGYGRNEYEDWDEYEEDGEEQEEEEEDGYEETHQPTQEELEYLELRQKLKESFRKKMKKESGTANVGSREKVNGFRKDNYGNFFGPSQPVISARVIQESKSLLENPDLAARFSKPNRPNNKSSVTHPVKSKSRDIHPPRVTNVLKKKAEILKNTRDYSFLLSEDSEVPASSKSLPPPRNVSAPKTGNSYRVFGGLEDARLSQQPSRSSNNRQLTNDCDRGRQSASNTHHPDRRRESAFNDHHRDRGQSASKGHHLDRGHESASKGHHLDRGHESASKVHHLDRGRESSSNDHRRDVRKPMPPSSQSNHKVHHLDRRHEPASKVHHLDRGRESSNDHHRDARKPMPKVGQERLAPYRSKSSNEPQKQLGSNNGSGPGRPIGLKGSVPSRNSVPATNVRKVIQPVAKSSTSGVHRPAPSSVQSASHRPAPSHLKSSGIKPTPSRGGQPLGERKPMMQKDYRDSSNKPKVMTKQVVPSSRDQMKRPPPKPAPRNCLADERPRPKPKRPLRGEDSDDENAISMIRQMFRYNPKKYHDDDDVSDMEANFEDIMREEKRSAKLAKQEDEEQLRLIEEEERRERMRQAKKRKLGH